MLAVLGEHKLRAQNLSFDIDVWYALVRDKTPETLFLPLSKAEAEAFVVHYRSWQGVGRKQGVHELSDAHFSCLLELESRLASLLQQLGGRAFLRLCGRSAKDCIIRETREQFDARVKALNGDRYAALVAARQDSMLISSGADAMHMLLSSERVYSDLLDFLEYGEVEQVVLRRWVPEMTLRFEFRCYIRRNKMIACSQYDHYGFYPDVVNQKERILESIESEWKSIHPLLRVSDYVADFLFVPETGKSMLIELSPLRPCTGAAFFRWTEPPLLEGSPIPETTEFRIATEVRRDLNDLVESWEVS